jgi:hypothetical protein
MVTTALPSTYPDHSRGAPVTSEAMNTLTAPLKASPNREITPTFPAGIASLGQRFGAHNVRLRNLQAGLQGGRVLNFISHFKEPGRLQRRLAHYNGKQ